MVNVLLTMLMFVGLAAVAAVPLLLLLSSGGHRAPVRDVTPREHG